MYADDIRMLYSQLKACYHREFNESLSKDDTYVPYANQCKAARDEITNFYFQQHYARFYEVNYGLQTRLSARVDDTAVKFNYFNYNEKQIKNMYNVFKKEP
jgi:hypothetical protein